LPQRAPVIPGVELAAFSRPALIIGGDYFDFMQFQNGCHAVAIADVAGHGVSAGLLMASVQTALRTLVPAHDSPAAVLQEVNRIFHHNIHLATFVTLFLASFDEATHQLVYSNAGHNPALVCRRKSNGGPTTLWLNPTGAAIGLIEEFDVASATIGLSAGDILLLYTDGVTEALNPLGEAFGPIRMADHVRLHSDLLPKDLLHELRLELQAFTGSEVVADDTTMVAIRIGEFG
jgi:sigma-B regulation protein RsbU (phosphoserine phosphatase)